jgi:hypothetical protein
MQILSAEKERINLLIQEYEELQTFGGRRLNMPLQITQPETKKNHDESRSGGKRNPRKSLPKPPKYPHSQSIDNSSQENNNL